MPSYLTVAVWNPRALINLLQLSVSAGGIEITICAVIFTCSINSIYGNAMKFLRQSTPASCRPAPSEAADCPVFGNYSLTVVSDYTAAHFKVSNRGFLIQCDLQYIQPFSEYHRFFRQSRNRWYWGWGGGSSVLCYNTSVWPHIYILHLVNGALWMPSLPPT